MIKSEKLPKGQTKIQPYSWHASEAVQKYTNVDITTPAGLLYVHIQFFSQSAPDFRRKLRQLEKGPETPPPKETF